MTENIPTSQPSPNPLQESPKISVPTQSSVTTATSTTTTTTRSFKLPTKFSPRMIIGGLFFALLIIGGIAAYYLSTQSQDVRQQAAYDCYVAGGSCQPQACSTGQVAGSGVCSGGLICCAPAPRDCYAAGGSCQPQACSTGQVAGSGVCSGGLICCAPAPRDCYAAGGSCQPQACSTGQVAGSGVCSGGLICCAPAVTPPSTPPSTPPTATPPGGTCSGAAQSCESQACCNGLTCQGLAGSRICQGLVPGFCGANATCGGNSGWLGFRCNSLSNGQCLENPQTFNSYQEAYSYASASGCGQVDEVCVGGNANRQLCGQFNIINRSCDTIVNPPPGESPPPGATPSPSPGATPSPPPGPVCVHIAMNRINPRVGDVVAFTCGAIPGVNKYEFRVKLPNGTIQALASLSGTDQINTSANFTINQAGEFKAQCRICPDNECQAWEPLGDYGKNI